MTYTFGGAVFSAFTARTAVYVSSVSGAALEPTLAKADVGCATPWAVGWR